jgi:hypothetical protein
VDDFEAVRTTPWEGVRNFEARNLMKQMAIGDKVRISSTQRDIPSSTSKRYYSTIRTVKIPVSDPPFQLFLF